MKTFVVYEKGTRNVIACIPESGEGFLDEQYSLKEYVDTEPVFSEPTEASGWKLRLVDNVISVDPTVWGRKG